jgi:hypothetical protein
MEREYLKNLLPLLTEEAIVVGQDPWGERINLDFSNEDKKLVIMLSDESHIPTNFKNCLVFRNYINPNNPSPNERPIPLPITNGYETSNKNISDRKYLASFSGYCGGSHRRAMYFILQYIKNKTKQNIYLKETEGFAKGLSKSEYSKLMSDTKLAICPWGNSYETFRLSESLKAGCIPVQIKRPLQWYDPKEECIWIDDWKELPKIFNFVAKMSDEELYNRSRRSIEFYESNISEKAVAKYINSEWKKFIGE